MVRVGDFSVRLVEAETKEPFKEHTGPDGKVYAEVEPGVEYYIEAEMVGGDDPYKMHFLEFYVAGTKLRYNKPHSSSDGKYHAGIWSRKDGVDEQRAISFQKPKFTNG
jgi:hypothetical protein